MNTNRTIAVAPGKPGMSADRKALGVLMAPLAVQEMVMAVWLITKGFNASAIAAKGSPSSKLVNPTSSAPVQESYA